MSGCHEASGEQAMPIPGEDLWKSPNTHEPCPLPRLQEEDPNTRIQNPIGLVNQITLVGICGVQGMDKGVESDLGVWSLMFIWSLGLGVWCFFKVHGSDARPSLGLLRAVAPRSPIRGAGGLALQQPSLGRLLSA